jgi:hypothetical protein
MKMRAPVVDRFMAIDRWDARVGRYGARAYLQTASHAVATQSKVAR